MENIIGDMIIDTLDLRDDMTQEYLSILYEQGDRIYKLHYNLHQKRGQQNLMLGSYFSE
ncbi:hypothetical protein HHI36_000735, partial [Cryptolaemus montrouzieri]